MLTFQPLRKCIPFIRDISVAKILSTVGAKSNNSANSSSRFKFSGDVGKVYKTTEIELEISQAVHDGECSMKSTAAINPTRAQV